MADAVVILHIVADLNTLGATQLGVQLNPDTDLGFRMYGGKDASGALSQWLAKNKPGLLASLILQDQVGGGDLVIYADNTGQLKGITQLPATAVPVHNGIASLQGGTVGEYYHLTAAETTALQNAIAAGIGDTVGPSSSADKSLAIFDGTSGKLLDDSLIFVADGGSGFLDKLVLAGPNAGIQLTTLINEFSTDGTLILNRNNALPTEQAVKTYVDTLDVVNVKGPVSATIGAVALFDGTTGKVIKNSDVLLQDSGGGFYNALVLAGVGSSINLRGLPITTFSIDGTLVLNSNSTLPTEQAVKTYVDTAIGAIPPVLSGRYTPVPTSLAGGITTVTLTEANWFRVGDMVTVFGDAQIDITIGGAPGQFNISLPAVPDFNFASNDLSGSCLTRERPNSTMVVTGATGIKLARFDAEDLTASNDLYKYNFSYYLK